MKKTLKEYKAHIDEAIDLDGPFSHNIISCVLREVSVRFGIKEANRLVREYKLGDRYGIHEEPENDDL